MNTIRYCSILPALNILGETLNTTADWNITPGFAYSPGVAA